MSWRDFAHRALATAKNGARRASETANKARSEGRAAAVAFADKAEKEAQAAVRQLEDTFDWVAKTAKEAVVSEAQVNDQLVDYARQVVKGNEKAFKALEDARSRCSVELVRDELFVPILQGSKDFSETEASSRTKDVWGRIIGDGGIPQDEWEWGDWRPQSLSIGGAVGGAAVIGISGSRYLAFGADRYIPYFYIAGEATGGFAFDGVGVIQLGFWRATNGQAYGAFIGAEGAFFGSLGGGVGVYFDPRIIPWIVINLAELAVDWAEIPHSQSFYPRAWQDFFQGGLVMGGVGEGLNVSVVSGYARRTLARVIYEAVV